MPGATYQSIYEIAADQHGYFTAAQARESGIDPRTVVMMERRGSTERVSHGLYRLVHFPLSPNALYMEATLWPARARGVLSHESALALYELSDVNPAKVHITVPRRFRVRRARPAFLTVHHADLAESDVDVFDGIPVTTPERAIRDCHATHLGPALVRQAIEDGRRMGVLSRAAADRLLHQLLPAPS
jgi:predicted transcriptional regulator of viral defense system